MTDISNEIRQKFPKILLNENLSKHCTFNIGGPADFYFEAKTTDEFIKIVKFAKKHNISFFIIGAGSNILFDDKGFRGLIIRNKSDKIEIQGDQITADAGVSIAKLVKKWIGLPGTVGGAIRGNAGCNGLETKDILISATILNPETAEIKEVPASYFEFDYRHSKLKNTDEIVLNATFKLSNESSNELSPPPKQRKNQPFGASTGSFFKNPSPENPAGMLIDKAGLKGKTIGKAQISEKHGNFLLNLGGATAKDIKSLAKLAKCEVKTRFNIDLEPEVQILSQHGKTKL